MVPFASATLDVSEVADAVGPAADWIEFPAQDASSPAANPSHRAKKMVLRCRSGWNDRRDIVTYLRCLYAF
jgi:hypothetical protein